MTLSALRLSASLVHLIPVLGLQQEHSLYSVDVKDAFLQVPQRTPCACDLFGEQDPNCRNEGLLLLRVLPGQRDAALLWSDHFAGTLKKQNFESHAQLYFEMTGAAFL